MAKKPDPDSAKSLLIEFYNGINKNLPPELKRISPNFSKECAQINSLKKKGYNPEQIRIAFNYLQHKKVTDLRYLNASIEDALSDKYYWDNRNIENSIGNIVQYFYHKIKVPFNRLLFLRQCSKIDQLLESYTPYELKTTIDYMYKKNISNFNFLESSINDALTEHRPINDLEDLRFGVKVISNNIELKEARKFFLNKTYFNNETLTPFEYAYLVRLPLDKELIEFGISNNSQYWRVDLYDTTYTKQDVLEYLKGFNIEL